MRLRPVGARVDGAPQRRDRVVEALPREIHLREHEQPLGHARLLGEHRLRDRAALRDLGVVLLAEADVDQHLGATQLRERVVGRDLERAVGGVERAFEVSRAAAVGGEQQERRRVVGLGARRLLDHAIGLCEATGAVVEARERIDQVQVLRFARERLEQHALRVRGPLLARSGSSRAPTWR